MIREEQISDWSNWRWCDAKDEDQQMGVGLFEENKPWRLKREKENCEIQSSEKLQKQVCVKQPQKRYNLW